VAAVPTGEVGQIAVRVPDPRKISEIGDSLAERSEFELPVPVSKLSDDNVVL
jgi:hypothetical protein